MRRNGSTFLQFGCTLRVNPSITRLHGTALATASPIHS